MQSEAIFTFTILVFHIATGVHSRKTNGQDSHYYTGSCDNRNLCDDDWSTCIDGSCIACSPENSVCNDFNKYYFIIDWPCCPGTTCEPIPGLINHHCRPNNNNCKSDYDCDTKHSGLRCLKRLGKCGLCKPDGELCNLVHDNQECCSAFCDISVSDASNNIGRCVNLFPFGVNQV